MSALRRGRPPTAAPGSLTPNPKLNQLTHQVPSMSASRRGRPPTRCARNAGEKLTRRYAAILRWPIGNTPACANSLPLTWALCRCLSE